ncbi:MAG: hypothetical protein ABI199_06235 [Bacteroidia bacterium]
MQFSLDIGIVVLGISAYFTVFVFKWDSVYARAWGIIVFIMALFILISWIWTYILQPLIAWL